MALNVSTFDDFTATFVGAVYRIATTHRPVVGGHFSETCGIIFTVVTAEGPF